MAGVQCPRMLWFRSQRKSDVDQVVSDRVSFSEDATPEGYFKEQAAKFAIGNKVDDAALKWWEMKAGRRGLKAVYVDRDKIGYGDAAYKQLARMTQDYMSDSSIGVINEACFYDAEDGVVVFCDFLVRSEDGYGWDIIENKASGNIKPCQLEDVLWQVLVARDILGFPIVRGIMLHPAYGTGRLTDANYSPADDDFEIVDDWQNWDGNGEISYDALKRFCAVANAAEPPEPECKYVPVGDSVPCRDPYRCNYIGICRSMLAN